MVNEAKSNSFLKKIKKNLNKLEKNWIGNPRFILTMVYLIWAHNTCGAQPSLPRNQKQILQMTYYFNFRTKQQNPSSIFKRSCKAWPKQKKFNINHTTQNKSRFGGMLYIFLQILPNNPNWKFPVYNLL